MSAPSPSPAPSSVVAVIPRQAFYGIVKLPNVARDTRTGAMFEAEQASVTTIEDAFTRSWECDAHLLGYLPEPFTSPMYRWNHEALAEHAKNNGRMWFNLLCVEMDTPGHQPWNAELWELYQSIYEPLAAAQDEFGALLRSALAYYSTRGGVRWVFRLDPPVAVIGGDADAVVWGVGDFFRARGIPADEKSDIWNRAFRLPRVLREGSRSEDGPFYFCELNPSATTPSALLPRGKGRPKKVALNPDAIGHYVMPDATSMDELLYPRGKGGKTSESAFHREAKIALHGHSFWRALFEHNPLVMPDGASRHDWAMAMIATIVQKIYRLPQACPEAVFALIVNAVLHLNVTYPGTRTLTGDEVWRQVTWAWEHEASGRLAEAKVIEENKAVEVQAVHEAQKSILTGVKQWNKHLPEDEPEAFAWIKQHAIVAVEDRYHVMKNDGSFSTLPVRKELIPSQVSRYDMGHIIQLLTTDEKGNEKLMHSSEILARYCVTAATAVVSPQIEGAYLTELDRENPKLVLPSFRRRKDLVPTFSPDVDLFIRAVAGPKYELMNRQIASFLAFERGATAAMSVRARSGSGKKLIIHGFMECLETPVIATARDLVERFNEGLMVSPFLAANEGFPAAKSHEHPSHTFRIIVTGDMVAVDRKNRPRVQIRNPMRVMFFGNNHGLLMSLCEGIELAPDDREAIAIRLIHYDTGSAARDLLLSRGGYDWTEGWIAGDSPGDHQPSNFTVAKHFLWLYEKYGKDMRPSGKHGLLVEGDLDDEILRMMRSQGGGSPIVAEVLMRILGKTQPDPKKVSYADGRFRVTAAAILDCWRDDFAQSSTEKLSMKRIHQVLKGWVVGHRSSVDGVAGRWNEIDCLLLAAEAEKNGWSAPVLDALVKAQASRMAEVGA